MLTKIIGAGIVIIAAIIYSVFIRPKIVRWWGK